MILILIILILNIEEKKEGSLNKARIINLISAAKVKQHNLLFLEIAEKKNCESLDGVFSFPF